MRNKISYDTNLAVKLSPKERDLIREHTFYDPKFGQLAAVEGKLIRFDLTLYDIEEIQGYVAAEANHCDNPKLVKELDNLFGKLQVLLDKYEVVDE